MADELNTPSHRWYQPRNNIALPRSDYSRDTIFDSGIQKIDAWINSQPWGNPVPGLFALAEPGVWYDPSDLTTLFQDAAGTTPVTAAGQPVGLVLDKSKGLVLGPELVTNGDFSAGNTGWTTQAGWTIGGGVASVNSSVAGTTNIFSTSATITAGKTYEVTYTVLSVSGAGIRASLGGVIEANFRATTGTFTARLTALTTASFYLAAGSNNTVATIDNISVRELPGNHATQATAASRPTYGVDANGRGHLSFDGVDDFLVTPTITPNIDKVQVFAGVRKLSDAAFQSIAEFGPSADANTGSFCLGASAATFDATRRNWTLVLAGSTAGLVTSALGFTAPDTRVVSGLFDLAQSTHALEAIMRINGASATVTQAAASAGTGNFNAYPIFIGRRAGTSAPFNGQLYGLIVRFGANLAANTISNTETWVNSKTGAY